MKGVPYFFAVPIPKPFSTKTILTCVSGTIAYQLHGLEKDIRKNAWSLNNGDRLSRWRSNPSKQKNLI